MACDEGSMMSGGCGALRMTMAFSLESLSAGRPCDFHLVRGRARAGARVRVRVRLRLRLRARVTGSSLALALALALNPRRAPEQLAPRGDMAEIWRRYVGDMGEILACTGAAGPPRKGSSRGRRRACLLRV